MKAPPMARHDPLVLFITTIKLWERLA